MIRKDRQATMDKQFLDPDSYVDKQGREVLKGEDWDARVEDLRRRSNGRCEFYAFVGAFAGPPRAEYERCSREARDPDHIIRRSKGRDDRLNNLQALCAFHHQLKHPEKQPQWTKRERREAILGEGR